jgi:N-acetylglucosaminyldiphosphoundecaprenol N-acetyl-beta-D-mannosaminyltransferase
LLSPGDAIVPAALAATRTRSRIGEAWIDRLTFDEALDAVERLIEAGTGGYVVTPNIDHVVNLESNAAFRRAYRSASLVLVDGQPLVWASRLLGAPLPERIAGADLAPRLMTRAAQRHWGVYLLGGPPGVAEAAAAKLRAGGVEIVGIDAPVLTGPPDHWDWRNPIEKIQRARPGLVLAAFGSPKQELWMHQARDEIRPAVALGVGAALDFLAGSVRRAPQWMSRAGMEWLFRLAQEPQRLWRRYLVNDPKFLLVLLRTLRLPRSERVRIVSG